VDAGHEERQKWAEEVKKCHVLYVDSALKDRVRSILGDVAGAQLLTIGDADDFARRGGMLGIIWKVPSTGWRPTPTRSTRRRSR